MSKARILRAKRIGDMVAVTVEVESDEFFSVEGVVMDAPDHNSEFHQRLHDDQITHAHTTRTIQETLYLPYPISRDLLNERIQALNAHLAESDLDVFHGNGAADTEVAQNS